MSQVGATSSEIFLVYDNSTNRTAGCNRCRTRLPTVVACWVAACAPDV